MGEQAWMARLREHFSSLNAQITVAGSPQRPAPNEHLLTAESHGALITCPASVPGAKDLLSMAVAMADLLAEFSPEKDTLQETYKRILNGDLSGTALDAAADAHHIAVRVPRAVLLCQTGGEGRADMIRRLRDIAPLQDGDVMVELDAQSCAVVRDVTEDDFPGDAIQYARALQETWMEESALTLSVGIGGKCDSLDGLFQSAREARRTLDICRVFHEKASVEAWDRILLRRLITELPDTAARYPAMLFSPRNERLFDREMMDTIDMFFSKDLNLSDTARQLFIHRNTLVYRLDKIQRSTGLDLRCFEDAVLFYLLNEINKRYSQGEDEMTADQQSNQRRDGL